MDVLGWKDILRPIRDGYRHLFPAPDTGPTPEERAKQREVDRLKGFTYFDTFEQLEAWTADESDPLQRANTPLLPRPLSSSQGVDSLANVLLCHDYSGNYHEYEHVQGAGVNEEQYSCEYLQFVDTFVYFSHKLACVPPPSWTNTLHRNGVKVLGTFLVEPQTKDTERLLEHTEAAGRLRFPLATKLADTAAYFGFDGWLMNIEKPFAKDVWNCRLLETFLAQLRSEIGPDGRVIWYDAITTSNKISYQNALTLQNLPFTQVCGSILTNYCWKEDDAWSSQSLALQHNIASDNIHFGVDVWAQNKSSISHPRITYPEFNGGGTRTGVAVAKLAEIGLSVGVFAPAWSFEHFPRHKRAVEQAMWEGVDLPGDLDCSCGNASQRHASTQEQAITHYAKEYPAGSQSFFYTDFTRAFAYHEPDLDKLYGDKKMHSELISQSILPCVKQAAPADVGAIGNLSAKIEDSPSNWQLVVRLNASQPLGESCHPASVERLQLPLFKLDMAANGSLRFRAMLLDLTRKISMGYYMKCSNGLQLVPIPLGAADLEIDTPIGSAVGESVRLKEIGVYAEAPKHVPEVGIQLLKMSEMCISPRSEPAACTIENIHVKEVGGGNTKHRRLSWTIASDGKVQKQLGMPYSEVTGPFSYFLLSINGLAAGRVYALEYILNPVLLETPIDVYAEVIVTGVGFDGRTIARNSTQIAM